MRIGLIAPPWLAVPPLGYGGTEVVVDNLARGLRALGHDVVLFTVGTSTCPVDRRYLYTRPVERIDDGPHEVAHALAAYAALDDVDLIHDHTMLGALLAGQTRAAQLPVVVTHHGPFTMEARRILGQAAARAHIVAISHSQAGTAGDVPITAVIHHGIDVDSYQQTSGGCGYLLFVGRMCPDKGLDRALRVAHRTGRPLKIVAKMREPAERTYYDDVVAPLLGVDDTLTTDATLGERLALLQHADALLNPIRWSEPFGLVMIEALACGVPVITSPVGAAPEIVDTGRTGFLCIDEDDLAHAVARIAEIDRDACRAEAVHRFSLERMTTDYLQLYERVLAGEHAGNCRSVTDRANSSTARVDHGDRAGGVVQHALAHRAEHRP